MAALSEIVWVFIAIIVLFYTTSFLKPLLNINLCSICLAVSLSWITLLVLRVFGLFDNSLIIALLVGESVVGGYYLWDRQAKKSWLIFRLPVLLTLTFIAWCIVSLQFDLILACIIGAVWAIHFWLYFYKTKPSVKTYFDKLIACCSRW